MKNIVSILLVGAFLIGCSSAPASNREVASTGQAAMHAGMTSGGASIDCTTFTPVGPNPAFAAGANALNGDIDCLRMNLGNGSKNIDDQVNDGKVETSWKGPHKATIKYPD